MNTSAVHSTTPQPRAARPRLRALFVTARLMLAVSAVTVAAPAAAAQGTDAVIRGDVRGATMSAIDGATVRVVNLATGFSAQTTTNGSGRFTFVQLPLGGPYSVTATAIGFRPLARTGIALNIGSVVTVEMRLTPVEVRLDAMAVVAEQVQTIERTGAATRIGETQLAVLPNQDRRFQDLTSLSPLAGAGTTLGGSRPISTDVRIDGVGAQMNNTGQTFAGPLTMSVEAIREFEVVTNEYDVSKGRQGGGLINAVTKTGTNQLAGSVFSYRRNQRLTASDFRGVAPDNFSVAQFGGSVGGPIVRDRLTFFAAYDRTAQTLPLNISDIRDASDENTLGIARDSLRRLTGILAGKYGLDTTRAETGIFNRAPLSQAFFGRLDWQIAPNHRLTLRNNTTLFNDPNGIGPDQTLHFAESRGSATVNSTGTLASMRSLFGSDLVNELKLQAVNFTRERTANLEIPRGFVRVTSALPSGAVNSVNVQFGGNRLAPEKFSEWQYQLANTLYWTRGSQIITVGTDNILSRVSRLLPIEQRGLFEFDNLTQLDAMRAARYSRQVPLRAGGTTATFDVADLSLFGQSEWRVGRGLSVLAGLRLDGTAFLSPAGYNPLVESRLGLRTDNAPRTWDISPRAQIIYDVDGSGRDVFRAGGGRFTSAPPYNVQVNHVLQTGLEAVDVIQVGAAAPTPNFIGYRRDPNTIPGIPAGVSASSIPAYVNLFAADFRTPTTWKASGGYERRLGAASLGVYGYYARTRDNFQYFDKNLVSEPFFRIEGGRGVFVPANRITAAGRTNNADSRVVPELGRVLELTGATSLEQRSLVLQSSLRLPQSGSLSVSYTRNDTRDNSSFNCCIARTSVFTPNTGDPRDLAGSYGPLDNNFRDKLVGAFVLPPVFGFRLSGRYVGISGAPFSLIVSSDINGDDVSNNDLAYVFDPDAAGTPADVAAALRRVLANPDNRARDYIAASVGRIASRNGGRSPFAGVLDMRVARSISVVRSQSVELTLDAFNVANLIKREWGGLYNMGSTQTLFSVTGFDQATSRYRYRVNENVGVVRKSGEAYQLQLGARYYF